MSFLFEKLSFGHSSRMTTAVVGLSLAAVGTAIYLSPAGESTHPHGNTPATVNGQPVVPPLGEGSAEAGSTTSPLPKPTKAHPLPAKVIHAPGRTDVVVVEQPVTHTVTSTITKSVTADVGLRHCSSFQWQQDAQTEYVANLSDPAALDGAAGPHNGDGIACNQLPVDPNRAASTPVDAYTPPAATAATKAALLHPAAKYFGIAQDGLPGDTAMLDRIATSAGKTPSSVEWFAGFDTPFPSTQVQTSWSRGALPMITWMSVAVDPDSGHASSEYTLTNIINGDVDDYLYKFAGDIVRTNLPVAIRFDHEMNNNTYPWSAGMYNNTPAKYVAAWQHVWNIFQQVGANDDAIWIWAPTRIDKLQPHAISGGGVGQTNLAEDYPGDQYVDWLGGSIYLRQAATGASYDATFGKTINALKALSSRPIFVTETAAAQNDVLSRVDMTATKASWITNALTAFGADPQIVGFSWFNNQGLQMVSGEAVTNDWRFDSSPPALTAFRNAVASPEFASGILPDGFGG